jgi:energy-converting hydrogenase Eha subunit F
VDIPRLASLRLPVQHAAALGIVQAGLTILAMLSPVANHASHLQWIIIAIVSIPAALAGGIVYRSRTRDERLEKAAARA